MIWIVFSITTEGTFLMPRNLSLLARQMSVTSILAIGMVLVIVAGQIDLSVGALAGLMGALSAMAYTNRDWPLAAAFLLVLVLGAALGAVQGSLVAWLQDPALHRDPGRDAGLPGRAARRHRRRVHQPRPVVRLRRPAYVPAMLGWVLAGAVAALFLLPRPSRATGLKRRAVGRLRRARAGRHRRS